MKNQLKNLLILVTLFSFMMSCQDEETMVSPDLADADSQSLFQDGQDDFMIPAKVQEQIDQTFEFWAKNFADADLQPVGIEKPKKITDESKRQAIMDNILAPGSHYATYDGESLSSMKVFQVKEMSNSGRFTQATRQTMDSRLQVGQGYALFKWKYKGTEFSTIYVYDENGFVYEPMAASIAIKKDNIDPNARTNWIQNFDLLWVWGGKRGEVKITHSSTCSGSLLNDHSGWSTAYMSLGSAQAEILPNGANTYKGSASWGYAWATSPITVSVTTDWGASGTYQGINWNGKVNASISGTLGSSGKATGFDVIGC
ncbi:hypothetical protein JMN32_10065 [Fulvivirga sp. 29W222]|uniref:Uncharacterized protein n=1 Tax=Fulvivirga marina TaxID=2494733 RepID=A0A937KBS7_9BACT|nr:hypothetical protein [Fulvivirga marina]MBL6446657.1 hypothetical protein [Fulvivirga marina]